YGTRSPAGHCCPGKTRPGARGAQPSLAPTRRICELIPPRKRAKISARPQKVPEGEENMADRPDVNALLTKTLEEQGVGVLDFTPQIHALNFKFPLYVRPGGVIGIVMHNTSGLVTLANLVGTWKAKEPNPPPSHLAIDRSGAVGRYVRLQYADRATEN